MNRTTLERMLRRAAELPPDDAGARGPGRGRHPCPPARELAGLADGATPARQRARLAGHLAGCDRCAALWKYLVEVVEDDGEEARQAPGDSRFLAVAARREELRGDGDDGSGHALPAAGWRAVAAGVMLLSLATWAYLTPPVTSTGDDEWRGGPATLAAEATRVEPGSVQLRWRAWPEADAYRVRVWSASGGLLVDERLGPSITEAMVEVSGEIGRAHV